MSLPDMVPTCPQCGGTATWPSYIAIYHQYPCIWSSNGTVSPRAEYVADPEDSE